MIQQRILHALPEHQNDPRSEATKELKQVLAEGITSLHQGVLGKVLSSTYTVNDGGAFPTWRMGGSWLLDLRIEARDI